MKVEWSHLAVVGWRMVLGEIIGEIISALLPMDAKLALSDTIAYPIESHVNGPRSALFDGVVGNSIGDCIVSLDWGGWLGPSHFFEGGSNGATFLPVGE